ncbi:MAG: hypothetical protein EPO27_10565 [Betaproteobacteria bacterium]|nr:MAG: hypothetical protein EPO27_10565 [Betaproteobacteria bacterium]
MILWRIYYGDGSTFSSEDGGVDVAPRGNVQRVAYYDSDGRRHQCHDRDYYYPDGDRWFGVDLSGLFQYLYEPGMKAVFFGRTIPDAKYRRIASIADNDLPLERAAK